MRACSRSATPSSAGSTAASSRATCSMIKPQREIYELLADALSARGCGDRLHRRLAAQRGGCARTRLAGDPLRTAERLAGAARGLPAGQFDLVDVEAQRARVVELGLAARRRPAAARATAPTGTCGPACRPAPPGSRGRASGSSSRPRPAGSQPSHSGAKRTSRRPAPGWPATGDHARRRRRLRRSCRRPGCSGCALPPAVVQQRVLGRDRARCTVSGSGWAAAPARATGRRSACRSTGATTWSGARISGAPSAGPATRSARAARAVVNRQQGQRAADAEGRGQRADRRAVRRGRRRRRWAAVRGGVRKGMGIPPAGDRPIEG